jgi:triosephosphate isomerase
MSRIPIIAANWKMHKTGTEAKAFVEQLKGLDLSSQVRIWIAPSFTALPVVTAKKTPFVFGAQNMHQADEGPFTGEISARMLKDAGADFVILGHSERRMLYQETDDLIHLKLKKAVEADLLPLLCIGETEHERAAGHTERVLAAQLTVALKDINCAEVVIAYEPVWAIGTGKAATPEMAEHMHLYCRSILADIGHERWAEQTSILYGGSVTAEAARALFQQPNVDGALVGGASLNAQTFYQIIQGVNP